MGVAAIPPSEGINQSPVHTIHINTEWWSHVSGVITRLTYRDAWEGTDEQISDAIEKVYQLLNIGLPLGLSTIFTNQIPDSPSGSDTSAVNLGVKFRTDTPGYIVGLRFYKDGDNTGTHTGYLFNAAGDVLGSLTFTGESASGWQVGYFNPPIAVDSCTLYLASYYAPNGHYATTQHAFDADIVNGHVRALKSTDTEKNGVYRYGSAGEFPNESYEDTNYFVDVLFSLTGS